jgi:hypothetical protein
MANERSRQATAQAQTQADTLPRVEAPKEKLVTRVVVGPKAIFSSDPVTGEVRKAEIGDTVQVTERAAASFAAYLEDPKLVEAKAAVIAIEKGEVETSEEDGE